MKKLTSLAKSKLALAALAAGAFMAVAVAGTTAGVLASIPDSSGVIHGCYKASGALRIIDTSSKKCGLKETAISWNQQGPQGPQGLQGSPGASSAGQSAGESSASTAYVRITGGPSGGAWDTARSKNITGMTFLYDPQQGRKVACITVGFEPENVAIAGGLVSPDMVGIRNTGLNPENDGWSDAYGNQVCGKIGNAFVAGYGNSTFLTFSR